MDLTSKKLFFQLLHEARRIRNWEIRHLYLSGMRKVIKDNREDFQIADDMRSYWINLSDHAE